MEQRANIKFFVKLKKKFAETYELIKKFYGADCKYESYSSLYVVYTM